MSTQNLSEMRSYLEGLINVPAGDSYIGSNQELQELNEAYEKTAYKFDWPQTLKRFAEPTVANVDRYVLQTDFRKFNYLYSWFDEKEETTIDKLIFSRHKFAVDLISSEYILSEVPITTTTTYTTFGSVSAGSSVTVTLTSVSGISVQDEIFINDSTSSEFTKVQSVSTANTTITVKLKNSHASGTVLYRVEECNYFQYQKKITLLSSPNDTTILPDDTDFIIPHYAAHLFYSRIEQYDRADKQLAMWDMKIKEAWLAWSKISTGIVGQFSIGSVF